MRDSLMLTFPISEVYCVALIALASISTINQISFVFLDQV